MGAGETSVPYPAPPRLRHHHAPHRTLKGELTVSEVSDTKIEVDYSGTIELSFDFN